ncbi:unnamed protein product [Adineta steineri]|uniref:Uncharacterized protein n=1 Tax=Adineta steineri TaxID=433720 RepID=A0A818G282_9BILA|nr:unnamed protein product [Adineta steineri]CAF3483022.1 unnamed protein product [Adineta steineri]
MAWVERMIPSEQDEQFESWRKEFQQERLLRIVREREIMKETAKRCKSYQVREQEANEAIERKRQAILAQRKAATVQATMRFQRNLPGFTVMDPDKFDRAIETITGRQLSNRSTPRRVTTQQHQQQQRPKSNTTFRRSISMEELGSQQYQQQQQQITNPYKTEQRHQTILARTNSVTHIPQHTNQVQYTSPLQEVQRRVLNDFAAQVQSTINQQQQQQQQQQFDETNTWDRESIDSLEESNSYQPQQIISSHNISGPIVRPTQVINIQTKQTQQPSTVNNSAFKTMTIDDQQEILRRSYHESFFVKNTPVTGNEQVNAWLGAGKISLVPNKHTDIIDKPSSLDGTDSEINGRRKSILKRSPSVDSNSKNSVKNTKQIVPPKKPIAPQTRTIGEKSRVKDSLDVINTKLLKEIEIQKKTVRFASDTDSERCASDTRLVKQSDRDNEQQTPLRRIQSAAILTLPNRPPIK